MISVSGRKWQEKKVNSKLVEKIQQDTNFSRILSKLIVSRNFDETEIYLIENNLNLSNVFQTNKDFIESVKLLESSIKNNENIGIIGDYDVDGSAATALWIRFLESINHKHFHYIPDREKDGYGASKKLLEKLIKKKPNLIVMVDCGSTSYEAVDYLNKNNIKSLVIDHHEINQPYPKANSIINPKKNNGYAEYDYFCATTLTYFFLDMLSKKIQCKIDISKYLIYVLLATVCDVMPIRGLNRLIAIIVLNEFNINTNIAFNQLYKLSNKKNKINIDDLAYLIGPILNSGGRLGKSNYATELLSSEKKEIVNKKSLDLINLNNKRKEIETATLESIDFEKIEEEKNDIIFYYNPNINEGLLGIIAARLKEYFNKPTFVITNSNNLLKSSARSIYNYNIGKVIKHSLDHNIILSGGGHSAAAGFTLKKENLPLFKDFVLKDFKKKGCSTNLIFEYESEISVSAFNINFFNDINKISPFGEGNELPIFLIKDLKVIKSSILKKKHVSCIFKSKNDFSINSICFDATNKRVGDYLLNYKKNINVVGQINENFWNNKKTLQLIIKDLLI